MSEKVVLAKVEGALFIGQEDRTDTQIIIKPRLVFANHETGEISFSNLIGDPEFIVVTKPTFSYYSDDPELDSYYFKSITPPEPEESPIIKPAGKIINFSK